MPSLIGVALQGGAVNGVTVAQNYRKTEWGSKFGTRELVIVEVAVSNIDFTDYAFTTQDQYGTVLSVGTTNVSSVQAGTSDGNFSKAVYAIQTLAEIYALGQPRYNASTGTFTFIASADTLGDSSFNNAVATSTANGNLNPPSGTYWADNANAGTLKNALANTLGVSTSAITITFTRLFSTGFA